MSKTSYKAAKYIRLSHADEHTKESDSVGNQRKIMDAFLKGQGAIFMFIRPNARAPPSKIFDWNHAIKNFGGNKNEQATIFYQRRRSSG